MDHPKIKGQSFNHKATSSKLCNLFIVLYYIVLIIVTILKYGKHTFHKIPVTNVLQAEKTDICYLTVFMLCCSLFLYK